MVATSSERGNEAFLERHGLSLAPPACMEEALDMVYRALDQASLFYGHGTDSAWDEAVFLLLSAADLPLDSDDSVLPQPVSATVWQRVLRWLSQRIELRKPLPYVTGRAWFAGLEFLCDERALVPRSPLGELIRNNYRPWLVDGAPARLLDLCCGGACIGIAAAVYQPGLEVVVADIDEQALALAQENIAHFQLQDRVTTRRSDLLDHLPGERFDVILCNPPYVNAVDLATMPAEYQAEPPLGLGSGVDGLDLTRRILYSARDHLTNEGLLFLELGNSWEALEGELSKRALTWLEFSDGGHGVLMVRRSELADIVRDLSDAGGTKAPQSPVQRV